VQPTEINVTTFKSLVTQLRPEVAENKPFGRDTRFMADLGLGSLELIGLVFLCEESYQVDLTSHAEMVATLQTVGETIDAIAYLRRQTV
jgi:acyl carrier protein